MTTNEKLTSFLKSEGIPLSEAAAQMGISPSLIYKISTGRRNVTWDVFHAFRSTYADPGSPLFLPSAVHTCTELETEIARARQTA